MSNPSAQKTSDSGADSESRKDSLPPHDEDAEAGALACVITGSEMMLGQLVRDHFYDLRHKEIYDALCQLRTDRTPITVVSLDILLRDQGRMLKAGGQDYISRLPDRTPNASFFPSYLDSLRNYSTRRTILRDTTELQRLAKDTAITIANVADAARRIAECYRNCGKVNGFTIRRPNEILGMAFDDNDIILGDRLLAIAQVLVIAAAGGIGKSRLACQLVACIISGKEFLGFRTGRPGSRILILQTENSNRRLNQDLARLKAWLGDDWPRFDDQVRIHTIETDEDALVSLDDPENLRKIEAVIAQEKPDIIIIDPLNDFRIGDLNNDEEMKLTLQVLSRVCRKGNTDRAIVILHHALTGTSGAAKATGLDRTSFARNSKVLHAWTRAQINLAPVDGDDNARLIVACGKCSNGREFAPFAIRLNSDMIYELDSTVNVKKWEMDISRPGARRKPTPTTEEFLSIFRNDPDNPRSCLLSASELRLKFRSRGWEDNSAPALRDECEGAGKLAIFHGAHNLKLVGLPAMVEAFRKKLSEKNSILEQVPLVTKQRGKKRKK